VAEILLKQGQRKKLSGTHSHFKVERYRSQMVAAEEHWVWRFNYCKCWQITARNANNYMLYRDI